MPVEWRPPGGGMGTVNLGELSGDQIVIHFGGALTSVDAYTFGNSLLAFADTIRAVNSVLSPEQNIEVRLEAIGPGSFRAVVKRLRKGLGGFFARGAEAVFWGIIATLIYENLIKNDPQTKITVKTHEVVIEKDGDTIIVPRVVYDHMAPVPRNTRGTKESEPHIPSDRRGSCGREFRLDASPQRFKAARSSTQGRFPETSRSSTAC